jgi:hypothetical protein
MSTLCLLKTTALLQALPSLTRLRQAGLHVAPSVRFHGGRESREGRMTAARGAASIRMPLVQVADTENLFLVWRVHFLVDFGVWRKNATRTVFVNFYNAKLDSYRSGILISFLVVSARVRCRDLGAPLADWNGSALDSNRRVDRGELISRDLQCLSIERLRVPRFSLVSR